MSADNHHGGFTGSIEEYTFAAMLFDMGEPKVVEPYTKESLTLTTDGTLVDSTDAIVKHWHKSLIAIPNSEIAETHSGQAWGGLGCRSYRGPAVLPWQTIDRYTQAI